MSSVGQQATDLFQIAGFGELGLPHLAFPFRAFRGQNMAAMGLVVYDPTRTRLGETFRGGTIGFNLRHGSLLLSSSSLSAVNTRT
jgi:hypothetical protein